MRVDLHGVKTDGNPIAIGSDDSGNLSTTPGTQLAGEDLARDRMMTIGSYNITPISTATTTVVKSGSGYLNLITINLAVALATITGYDNTSATGTPIFTITFGATVPGVPVTVSYEGNFTTGLTIVTSGATNLSVSYL